MWPYPRWAYIHIAGYTTEAFHAKQEASLCFCYHKNSRMPAAPGKLAFLLPMVAKRDEY